ncbi:Protein N-acetyltransferase, RimJ/RimL family [Muriicola jejuensis]|uniref:GNAT family N-acetyltransferase n=1 Tax=Muriicola jejuensis TaxID=504488 RepID=A0A6P0UEW6_9FLAO|nr:GNAT family N-acetyltransferase [Muriicola jejuensis]NER11785.1 GNAT family N-acetyltransferase [Muriicola jejuensis]SMP26707.1 Protein N-acetyltransferase, RimJ/RimL family [Muriicola jejuensis]
MKYLMEGEETERLLFRKIQDTDYTEWLEFHKDPRTHEHWISDLDSPEQECRKWYQNQNFRYENNLGGMNVLIEKASNELIGHCGLLVQNVDGIHELEIGYSLLPKFWNNGYAIEAAKNCRDHAFLNNYSESLISIISLTNEPSKKVAIKNGMRIDKTTVYNANEVFIFRITKEEWRV